MGDDSTTDAPVYAGIDLGTTNSAAAVFDGDRITVVRNAQGGTLTPSVVRIDGKERVTVGTRARKFLDSDPDNTRTEFKRLMGTGQKLEFDAASLAKLPEELAAEVLRAIRADIADQIGVAPKRAVISVPALFELPQNSATSEAARLAGFERVELIQEPIASALAAGWRADDGPGTWLVYDMGGGTFDVSLLETRDGLLRVVGHDGDNFLGGRDFDWAIVEWVASALSGGGAPELARSNPNHDSALRALKIAAEEAKIELSRSNETVIALPRPLEVGGEQIDVDVAIDRATLEQICAPIIDRSLNVCRRLLESHGLRPNQLGKIVLIGGPTVTPFLRERIADSLGIPIAEGHDPMTMVARGAAIYAATAGLDGRPESASHETAPPDGRRLWLQYPAVSSDLTPHVVGRVMDGNSAKPTRIRLTRDDGQWEGTDATVDEQGAFVTTVDLVARRPNVFSIGAFLDDGAPIKVHPSTITIVQGITISDPPLSRTVGVALANDHVQVYFERGAPLPARRTFTHKTVESVAKGSADSVLTIPIVQGEFDTAHLCRLIGKLEIPGDKISDSLPTGTSIELTIELDRGGRMSARALVPSIEQVFESVAHLLVPDADPEVLEATLSAMRQQIVDLRTDAFRNGWTAVLERLDAVESRLLDAARDVDAAQGGDADAGQKARRALIELDATLADAEMERKWPELEDTAVRDMAWASSALAEFGTVSEQRLFKDVADKVERARADRNVGELQRQLRLVNRLAFAAYNRNPEVWEWRFEAVVSEADSATNIVEAQALIREGRDAIDQSDNQRLRSIVRKLWKLMPPDVQAKRQSFDSSVR
jgi:molecular chaperone DnaK